MPAKTQPVKKTPQQLVMEAKIWAMLKSAGAVLLLTALLSLSLWGVLSYFSLPVPNPLQVLGGVVLLGLLKNEADGLRKWWRSRI